MNDVMHFAGGESKNQEVTATSALEKISCSCLVGRTKKWWKNRPVSNVGKEKDLLI